MKHRRRTVALMMVFAAALSIPSSGEELKAQQAGREDLRQLLTTLKDKVEQAGDKGVQTLYAEVPLVVGNKFIEEDWLDEKIAAKRADWALFLARQAKYELGQLEAILAGQPNRRKVPPIPDYAKLEKKR